MEKQSPNKIGPQPGPQEEFLKSRADVVFYGGAAGGGKTFSLLLEPLRHYNNKDFSGVIFRRTSTQVTNPGGLWDESAKLYSLLGAEPFQQPLVWKFQSGMKMKFGHLEHDFSVHNWQGSQIPFIGWDELTLFSAKQFWFMFSRNRSVSGVKGYIRATCNPDPDSFVAPMIEWYLDEEGYPIPERSGVLRYFLRLNDELIWADSPDELTSRFPEEEPKSFTFIPAKVEDNQILLKEDPQYLSNLKALSYIDRMRLLSGNWKIRASAGTFFRQSFFELVDALPPIVSSIRYWDRAATQKTANNKPDWTVGLKLSKSQSGTFYVEHVERFQADPSEVMRRIRNQAIIDGSSCAVGIEQDPGSAGKFEVDMYVKELAGFDIKVLKPTVNKQTRAKPASAQAEQGNIKILKGPWNHAFINEAENFPDSENDDQVDALSGAFQCLSTLGVGSLDESYVSESSSSGSLTW